MENRTKKIFWLSIVFTLIIKILLSKAIPLTSDEAYFTLWSKYLDFGYYDHPPMVGWILHIISYIGNSVVLIRLPAVLTTTAIGILIYFLLKKYDNLKAILTAMLFIVSPINILNVLITTDTPLILFAFISAAFFYKTVNEQKNMYYFLSGTFLGCAFLSKYFAVLLGISYLFYFVFYKNEKIKIQRIILLFAAAAPFVLINIYWNYNHCWVNIMFNLFNRNKKEEFSLIKPLIFIAAQLYLITPPVLYFLIKKRKEFINKLFDDKIKIFTFTFFVPLTIFALLSFKKVIGLHWVLSFYPFMYIIIFVLLTHEELLKSIKFMLFFSIAHLFIIGTVLSLPVKYFKNNKNYPMIIMGTEPDKLIQYLKQYQSAFNFATPSYADSALLTYHWDKYFSVFGGGSHHARQDDINTDFKKLNGQNILILKTSEPLKIDYADLFANVQINKKDIDGAVFYVVLGYGFKYAAYKEKFLIDIKNKYYAIPAWLPYSKKSCYFYNKYFD